MKVEIIKHGTTHPTFSKKRVCPECGRSNTSECYDPEDYKYRCTCKDCGCVWKDQ